MIHAQQSHYFFSIGYTGLDIQDCGFIKTGKMFFLFSNAVLPILTPTKMTATQLVKNLNCVWDLMSSNQVNKVPNILERNDLIGRVVTELKSLERGF